MQTGLATISDVEPRAMEAYEFEGHNSLPPRAPDIRALFAEARKKGNYQIAPEFLSNMAPAELAYLQEMFCMERQELEQIENANFVDSTALGFKQRLMTLLYLGKARYLRAMEKRIQENAAKRQSLNEHYPKR